MVEPNCCCFGTNTDLFYVAVAFGAVVEIVVGCLTFIINVGVGFAVP